MKRAETEGKKSILFYKITLLTATVAPSNATRRRNNGIRQALTKDSSNKTIKTVNS